MKKIIYIKLLLVCALTTKAQTNLVLNGSFELNSAVGCYNSFTLNTDHNNCIPFSFSFGSKYSTGLFMLPCSFCIPPSPWGGLPIDGDWALGLDGYDETMLMPPPFDSLYDPKQGKLTLELSDTLASNKRYKLSFYAKSPPTDFITPFCLTKKGNFVTIGISNYEDQIGTELITTPKADTAWTYFSWVFKTQNAEKYISIKAGLNDTTNQSILVDNFVLVETEEALSVGISEHSKNNKQLIKIVDVLGKETPYKKNTPLFYLYNDGTVEKKIFVE